METKNFHHYLHAPNPYRLGTHKWFFMAAKRCKDTGLSAQKAGTFIESKENKIPPYFKLGEIIQAISCALSRSIAREIFTFPCLKLSDLPKSNPSF
jgi:hypothetical protein